MLRRHHMNLKNTLVYIFSILLLSNMSIASESSFIADEPAIFGTPSEDYIQKELDWYLSGSTNVNDIAASIFLHIPICNLAYV